MQTDHDQKQLLILGYLRELIHICKPHHDLLSPTDNINHAASLPGSMSPMLTPTMSPIRAPMSILDEHMTLFSLGAPAIPQSPSEISGSDPNFKLKNSLNVSLPLDIIQTTYFYYNRHQNYLFLLSGSEECKNNSYNEIQIINVRNVSDIEQNIDYPYMNYRLKPHLWKNNINYTHYFKHSLKKYNCNTAQSVVTPQPLTISPASKPQTTQLLPQSATHIIKVNSPLTAFNNSPFSPLAQVLEEANNDTSLSPYAVIGKYKALSRPRAKSTTNVHVLKKKDIAKMKAVKMKRSNKKNKKSSAKTKKNKKRQRKSTLPTEEAPSMMDMTRSQSLRSSPISSKKKKKDKVSKNIVMFNRDFDRYSFGECIVSISNAINGTLPQWPWFTAKYHADVARSAAASQTLRYAKYKMYIRCGGIQTKDDEYTNENDLLLFNAANLNDVGRDIDSYYCKLPKFKQKMESPAIVYNQMDRILSFGGYSYDEGKALKMIYSLNLNTEKKKFKWRKYGNLLNKARYDASVVHIKGENKFVIIGGKGSNTKAIDSIEIFDASKTNKKATKCIALKELNFKRFKPGSCELDGGNRGKIAVAGGIMYGKGTNKIEIFDLYKNECVLHATSLQYGHQHPTVWSQGAQINPNILYIAGNNISFGAKKGSMGFMEWMDLRENKEKCNLLYDENIEELYELWGIRPNIWEPRSLLHFAL